jgi:hypothetical protein
MGGWMAGIGQGLESGIKGYEWMQDQQLRRDQLTQQAVRDRQTSAWHDEDVQARKDEIARRQSETDTKTKQKADTIKWIDENYPELSSLVRMGDAGIPDAVVSRAARPKFDRTKYPNLTPAQLDATDIQSTFGVTPPVPPKPERTPQDIYDEEAARERARRDFGRPPVDSSARTTDTSRRSADAWKANELFKLTNEFNRPTRKGPDGAPVPMTPDELTAAQQTIYDGYYTRLGIDPEEGRAAYEQQQAPKPPPVAPGVPTPAPRSTLPLPLKRPAAAAPPGPPALTPMKPVPSHLSGPSTAQPAAGGTTGAIEGQMAALVNQYKATSPTDTRQRSAIARQLSVLRQQYKPMPPNAPE